MSAAVSDFANVDIEEEFLPFLSAEKRFMEDVGVKEFTLPDQKKKLLVCVVAVAAKGDSAKAIGDMEKVCRAKAQSELQRVREVEISTFTRSKTKISSIDDGRKVKTQSLSSYLNIEEERACGFRKAMPKIGTWFSKDKTIFYFAVGSRL